MEKLMFCRDYEIESWSRFGQDFEALWSFLWRCWCLVEVEVDAWSRFWRWNLIKICVWTCDMNSTLGSVVPLAMFFQEIEWSIYITKSPERQVSKWLDWIPPVAFLKYKIVFLSSLPTFWYKILTIYGLIMKNNTTAKH